MWLVSLLLLCVWAPAQAQTFPKPNNTRVVDAANILAPADDPTVDDYVLVTVGPSAPFRPDGATPRRADVVEVEA